MSKANNNFVPPPEPGLYNIPLTHEEMWSLIQLLTISKETHQFLLGKAVAENKLDECQLFNARAELSAVLANKFTSALQIGEPESRSLH